MVMHAPQGFACPWQQPRCTVCMTQICIYFLFAHLDSEVSMITFCRSQACGFWVHCGAELKRQCHKAPYDNCASICQGSSRPSSSQDAGDMHLAHTHSSIVWMSCPICCAVHDRLGAALRWQCVYNSNVSFVIAQDCLCASGRRKDCSSLTC